jgi:hypothetical protein
VNNILELGTPNKVPFLPTHLDKEHTQLFHPEEFVVFTSGIIASGKDQMDMLIIKDLLLSGRYPNVIQVKSVDPDQEFPPEYNPKTDDPMLYFDGNRERSLKKYIHLLNNPIAGDVPLFQSGGATLGGKYGRGEMVMEAMSRKKKAFHVVADTPPYVAWRRNKGRQERGDRYTPSEEFWRCVEKVKPNFELLSKEQRGDGIHFPEDEIISTGMVLRYITKYKYEVIWPDGTSFYVHYHWERETDDPYLTMWE